MKGKLYHTLHCVCIWESFSLSCMRVSRNSWLFFAPPPNVISSLQRERERERDRILLTMSRRSKKREKLNHELCTLIISLTYFTVFSYLSLTQTGGVNFLIQITFTCLLSVFFPSPQFNLLTPCKVCTIYPLPLPSISITPLTLLYSWQGALLAE